MKIPLRTKMESIQKVMKADNFEIVNGWALGIGKPSTKRLNRLEAEEQAPATTMAHVKPRAKVEVARELLRTFRDNASHQTQNHEPVYAD